MSCFECLSKLAESTLPQPFIRQFKGVFWLMTILLKKDDYLWTIDRSMPRELSPGVDQGLD